MILDKTRQLTVEEELDALDILIKVNDLNFNKLKVVEEMSETIEVLVKQITKKESLQPNTEALIEELGDTLVRITILTHHLDINEDVDQRYNDKLRMLKSGAESGYIGTKITIAKEEN